MKATLWSLAVFFIPLSLVIGLLWFGQSTHWVGGKPLKIRFLVVDAKTRMPVPSAEIGIYQAGESFCDCDVKDPRSLAANEKGEATVWCRDCLCSGTTTWRTNTFHMLLPPWYVTAKAPGYRETDPGVDVDSPKYQRHLDRGTAYATLTVSLELSPSTAKKRSN